MEATRAESLVACAAVVKAAVEPVRLDVAAVTAEVWGAEAKGFASGQPG